MAIKIALAGNPNSGKTTLFNALTGSNQYVGNWPGVTVEKKDGVLKGTKDVIVQDLPGIYSLSPYSLEEKVSRKFLVEEKPDVILNIVDGSNIERNLYLSTQLAELGIPMVMAVNMMDIVKRNGDSIDFAKIAKALRCEVVGISAVENKGCAEAAAKAVELAKAAKKSEAPHVFTGSVEHAIAHIEESIQGIVPKATIRWFAIKIFEHDREIIESLQIPVGTLKHIEEHIRDCEKEMDDDAESIVTNQRYEFINDMKDKALTRNEARKQKASISDRIDKVVTNRILALPIFLLSLCVMWFLAVSDCGPGSKLTDWANDGFLADGWFLPWSQHEVDGKDYETVTEEFEKAEASIAAFEGKFEDPEKITEESAKGVTASAQLEDEETGEVREDDEGNPMVWDVDYAAYLAAKEVEEPDPSKYGFWVPGIGASISAGLEKVGANEVVTSLVVDGAWGGVATVLGFVPVITIVFLFLAFLEDCGYMARVAFIMDRIFRKFGLSGKSFIPIIVGKGCGVPAVMAARTIENERDHRMTVILSTFVPCGAKTVIIAMIAAIFFREQWYIAALMDIVGIAIIVLGGIALKKMSAFKGEVAPFVMELPAYHLPTVKAILIRTWQRVKGYMFKAGLIIFPACVFLWFIMHFDWSFTLLSDEQIEQSMLHDMGSWIAWFFAPLGFGTWWGAAASVSAEIAKEQATATLGLVAANLDGSTTASRVYALFGGSKLAALSFMVFNLFIPPCMVAIATTFREIGSKKWGWIAVGFQMFVGYVLAMSIYQIGTLVSGGGFSLWVVPTVLIDLFCLWMIFRPSSKK